MGYDIITWNPRISAIGDDAYNIPGATKLDDTQDAGGPTRIEAGETLFSTVPIISELNASSGINQIIGLINRRIQGFKNAFPGLLYPFGFNVLPYLVPNSRITAASIAGIAPAINAIRQAEGFANFVFDANPGVGSLVKGKIFSQFRKALRISGVSTRGVQGTNAASGIDCTKYNQFNYLRVDNPYGTFVSDLIQQISAIGIDAGKHFNTASTFRRLRLLYTIIVPPDWTMNAADVHLLQNFSPATLATTLEAFDLNLYSANLSEYPRTIGGSDDMDNLEAQILAPAVSTQYSLAIDPTRFASKAGNWFSMIFTTAHEAAGTGVSTFSGDKASGYDFFNVNQANNSFIVDFGA
jgi:hypothetical protein